MILASPVCLETANWLDSLGEQAMEIKVPEMSNPIDVVLDSTSNTKTLLLGFP